MSTDSQITKPLITDDEVRALWRRGKNIDAIRELRARDGLSLYEARSYMESLVTADDKAARDAMNQKAIEAGATFTPDESPKLVLAWGLGDAVPDGAKLAWGGRAIYSIRVEETPQKRRGGKVVQRAQSRTIASIDIPHDRQGVSDIGNTPIDERRAFGDWINNKALPALKRWCERHYVTGDSDEKFELLDGSSYALVASPRASYGYLYIAAWVVPPGGLGDAHYGKALP